MTGRAGGYCSGSAAPGFARAVSGRDGGRARNCPAWGQGSGRGRRSWRNMAWAANLAGRPGGSFGQQNQADPAAEKNFLKNRAAALQSELDQINSRLQEREAESAE